MAIVERHISPDGLLQLIVDHADDGDWTVGFSAGSPSQLSREQFNWHTHGDILAWSQWGYVGSPGERVRSFVADVVSSRRVIVIWRRDGRFTDAQVEDNWGAEDSSCGEMKNADPGESIEKRFWNGQPVSRAGFLVDL